MSSRSHSRSLSRSQSRSYSHSRSRSRRETHTKHNRKKGATRKTKYCHFVLAGIPCKHGKTCGFLPCRTLNKKSTSVSTPTGFPSVQQTAISSIGKVLQSIALPLKSKSVNSDCAKKSLSIIAKGINTMKDIADGCKEKSAPIDLTNNN
eukprot:516851_1